ncbi:sulfate transporter 2.1-like [Miscanthus floridulus]|uniref:sulfate transporter 2.1-like n=1 Tax=Miscanthus floridulus TaxID=154761 RepID=UPI003459AFBA
MEASAAVESSATVSVFEVSNKRPDTAKLVLNSPSPPSLREELVGVVGKAFRPRAPGGGRAPCCPWILTALQCVFPVLQWGRTYTLKSFRSDVMAGLTLASLGIPQSIGYANLAKLDPQYGLYTSVVPPLIYAVMGTSREIGIGPVAVVSLLLSSMIQKVVDPAADPATYRSLVFTVTLLAGVFQVSFGLFRLGFLVDFLSHAAIVGFMGGAAIVIGLQQLKGLLGLSHFTNSTDVVSVVKAVCSALHDPWHPGNFLIGCSFLIFILTTPLHPKFIWRASVTPKVKFFFWLALHGCLWTAEHRKRHGLQLEANYALCDQDDKTTDHLLASCSFTREVWVRLLVTAGLQQLGPRHDSTVAAQQLGHAMTQTVANWWMQTRVAFPQTFRRGFDSLVLLISWRELSI